jgi:hypothetical protein|nr:MAG TPA_asm: hypothetical protein [Caudoviricetes sp.]
MAITYKYAIDGDTWSTDANGTTTLTRELVFELTGADYGKLERLYKSDKAPQIPVKGAAHPNNSLFKATGEKSVRKEADGKNAVVTVKYSCDDSISDTNWEKKPWELGFSSLSTSVEVIAKPMLRDVTGAPVESTSGTGIEVVHDERHVILRATYAVERFDAGWIEKYSGTVNEKEMRFGEKFKLRAGMWRIRDLSGTNVKTTDDKGKEKWNYYNVSIELEGVPWVDVNYDKYEKFYKYSGGSWVELGRGQLSGFATVVGNRSTRMVVGSGSKKQTVRIHQCKKTNSEPFFGSYEECFKVASNQNGVEEVSEPVWLKMNGTPELPDANGKVIHNWLCYKDFVVKDWSALSFPKK